MAGKSVTVVKDSNITVASADPSSEVAAETEVELTITPATGYEAVTEVLAGGVTIEDGAFEMGDEDVIISVKGKKANTYRVTEETMVNINDQPLRLHRNVVISFSANGAIRDTSLEEVVISNEAQIEALLRAGLIEKV